ncbi:aminopeptidase N [Mucilaginibacter sp. OAE612]|uniref:M1 family aminopeptidase n=1 Tax=Mucilaginibacter sp. OAE612 TaxID=3156444 RepID=UPI00359E3FCD
MKIFLTATAILLSHFFVSAQETALPVQPGVSLSLAKYRKAAVHNIKYKVEFKVPELKNDPVDGSVSISFSLSDNAQPLQLDFKQPVSQVIKMGVNGHPAAVNLKHEHILIETPALKKGANEIKINFIAGNASLNRNDDYLYALFVPDHARSVFPCFDQPDLKAIFQLSLRVPAGWKVLANGILKDSLAEGFYKIYHFMPSDQLPTYLFSFTAGQYESVKKRIGGRDMEFLYRETDEKKIKLSLDSVFDLHSRAINFLENWTGIKYPFQKTGFVAIPDFQFGGMEHPGEVQYKASSLFLDDAATKEQLISRV